MRLGEPVGQPPGALRRPLYQGECFIKRGAAAWHEKLPGNHESALRILMFRLFGNPPHVSPTR